jgi:hypothetical protein
VRDWLSDVSVDHHKIYAWLDLEAKAKVIACCKPEPIKPAKHWPREKGLMSFLKSLWPSISYVAVEPVRAVPVAGCLNERYITGIATNGTIRREYLDQTLFWTAADLEENFESSSAYFKWTSHALRPGRTAARAW